jgi:hypothetical protein
MILARYVARAGRAIRVARWAMSTRAKSAAAAMPSSQK